MPGPSKLGPGMLGPSMLGPSMLGPGTLGPVMLGPVTPGPNVLGPAIPDRTEPDLSGDISAEGVRALLLLADLLGLPFEEEERVRSGPGDRDLLNPVVFFFALERSLPSGADELKDRGRVSRSPSIVNDKLDS